MFFPCNGKVEITVFIREEEIIICVGRVEGGVNSLDPNICDRSGRQSDAFITIIVFAVSVDAVKIRSNTIIKIRDRDVALELCVWILKAVVQHA